jgi:nicotinamidase-related amidase
MWRSLVLSLCALSSCWLLAQQPAEKTVVVRERKLVTKAVTVEKEGITVIVTATEAVEVHYAIRTNPEKCAIIICDMWDNHWCPSAAKRCEGLAKKAAPFIEEARKNGMIIIHCPSDTMKFYADHASRKKAKETRVTKLPEEKKLPDPKLPIDDKDGGCDDDPAPASFRAWTRQHEAIKIDADKDYITDVGTEVYNIITDRNIERVFVMGVHTNMCVLHRSFAIKQLKRWGVNCYLVRDITDTMYNPKSAPFVSHDKGTELVIEFIELNWCPTTLSTDIFKKQ